MTTNLPDDLRQAIEKEGGSPVHIVDMVTNVHYVLIRAEQYDNLNGSFASDEKFDTRDFYPLIAKSAASARWDDRDMDAYNDYDKKLVQLFDDRLQVVRHDPPRGSD
jgi:hypothetical protein